MIDKVIGSICYALKVLMAAHILGKNEELGSIPTESFLKINPFEGLIF